MKLTVPSVNTPWGLATNLVVVSSIRDLFTDVAESGVDIAVSADRAWTPWGEGDGVSVKGHVQPAGQDIRGVVRAPQVRADTVASVARAAKLLGLGVRGVVASPLPGPAGNVEYFLWLQAGAPPLDDTDLARAVAEGPS